MGIYDELAKLDTESPTPGSASSDDAVIKRIKPIENEAPPPQKTQEKTVKGTIPSTDKSPSDLERRPQKRNGAEAARDDPKDFPERSDERTSEVPYERTNVQKGERRQIRHAFDIFEDQLRALQALQLQAVQADKQKPKLGQMVQSAIDLLLEAIKRGEMKAF